MKSFGQMLRLYRRQCKDVLRGGMLTQERLGELLGHELGDAGYSGAAVSDWELDKSKIHQDNRLVLVKLLLVLRRYEGLYTLEEANGLLLAGNYRPLDQTEQAQIFPGLVAEETTATLPISASPPALPQPISTASPERRNQLVLLHKVKHFWVEGVLEKSLAGGGLIDLLLERYDEGIDHPWQKVVGSVYQTNLETFGQNLAESFQAADRALLILGTPGAGKTTSLISLARHFISLAEAQPTHPIPVILNLASWAEGREKLADWVVEELTAKYQIPRQPGRNWLESNELLLLLDGLDEMPAGYRAVCISAINQFRETHGLTGLVVCCRREAYEALPIRLKLGGAVLLRPLTPAQIDSYLAQHNPNLTNLRTAVQQDPLLQAIAQSPLMLNVMSLAYQDTSDMSGLGVEADTAVSHHSLFEQYIQRMFQRRAAHPDYSPAQTRTWLSWLAQKMSEHSQTVLLIEDIQPGWLPARQWQWFYLITSRLINGLFIGFYIWLYWLLIRQAGFSFNWANDIVQQLPFPPLYGELFVLLLLNSVLGIAVGVVDGLYYDRQPMPLNQKWQLTAVTGLTVGLLGTLALLPLVEPLLALSFGVVSAVSFALTTHYIHGRSLRDDIRPVEALSWSWAGAARGVFIGLLLFVIVEWVESQLRGPTPITRSFVGLAVPFLLLGGLQGKRLATTNRPNEGIWLSAGNALITAVLLGLSFGLMGSLLWNISYGLVGGLLAALIASGLYGGGNVVNHVYLRFLLWYGGWLPWNMTHFLNYAADCVLLHKVGGGYIFIHSLFQDYFATTSKTSSE